MALKTISQVCRLQNNEDRKTALKQKSKCNAKRNFIVDEKLKKRIEELVREEITVVPYNPAWPKMFKAEAAFLRKKLPKRLIKG